VGYIYLAQGYSHEDDDVREARYELGMRAVAAMLHNGFAVYAPVVHNHPVATRYNLPMDFEWWRKADLALLSGASELWVLDETDWQTSKGFAEEHKWWLLACPNRPARLLQLLEGNAFSTSALRV
jgi:hypothetical protein